MENNEIKNSKLIPRLRFPGFEGEWDERPLGKVCDTILVGFPFKGQDITDDGTGHPILRAYSIGEGVIRHGKDYDKYYPYDTKGLEKYKVKVGDIVISMDGSVGRNIALVSKKENDYLLIQRVARLRITNYPIHMIYQQIISQRFKDYATGEKVGAVIAHISQKQIESFPIYSPRTLPEQQKIASCLSELDNLIAAQGQKVDALKEKKKGLMQQLFPQPGETTPRLRFPGFEGEWEEKKLGEVANFQNGYAYNSSSFANNGDYVIRISDIKSGTISLKTAVHSSVNVPGAFKVVRGDILIAMSGATTGKIGEYQSDEIAYINQRVGNIKPFDINKKLLLFLLQSDFFTCYLNGILTVGAQPNISSQQICAFGFMLPPTEAEQQQIASCLSSLDDLIAAESAKVEALKDHKKGLMQQLFPQPTK